MNPTELQRRLDGVALAPETASPQDWERNRALVARRRRRRRAATAGLAGLAAAAAVAAVLVWNPAADHLELVPAQPPAHPDGDSRLVDPRSLDGLVAQCTENAEHADRLETPTPVFGASSDLVDGVLYEYADGSMRFCSSFQDGGTRADGPVSPDGADARDPDAPEGAPRRTTWAASTTDGAFVASYFGFVPTTVDRVVVSTPDGEQYEAAVSDGRWWTSVWVPDEDLVDAATWQAFDAAGRVVEEGPPPQ